MKENVKVKLSQSYLNLLKNKSYLEISVSELCAKADVSRVSFYRNFANFDELLNYTIDNFFSYFVTPYVDKFVISKKDAWEAFLEKFLKELYNRRANLYFPLPENMAVIIDKMTKKMQSAFKIAENKTEGIYQSASEIGVLISVISVWGRRGFIESPEEIQQIVLSYIF